jgi:3-deoxy-7-phosphoheptulonate synthase
MTISQLKRGPAQERFEGRPGAPQLVGRGEHPHDSQVEVGGLRVGGRQLAIIAGPCAVESAEQIEQTAAAVKRAGARFLRGGAFKARTSPYDFQGLGAPGLELLAAASRTHGLPSFTEVPDASEVELIARQADALQVGARNMQNYRLLTALGRCGKPVLLKRGISARLEELLLAAEYVVSKGNPAVILCERGIRTFETATRNTLDLNAVPYLKQQTHLPVIVDPSHGVGIRDLVPAMARAAIACGADGLLIEVHLDPPRALSDGQQSLYPQQFAALLESLRPIAEACGRSL